jgi:hypothetical protein
MVSWVVFLQITNYYQVFHRVASEYARREAYTTHPALKATLLTEGEDENTFILFVHFDPSKYFTHEAVPVRAFS